MPEELIRILREVFNRLTPEQALVGGLIAAFPFAALTVAIIGRIAFTFGVWNRQAQAADQPQTATTTRTPRQVVRESDAARRRLAGCHFAIVVFLVLVLLVMLASLGLLDDILASFQ